MNTPHEPPWQIFSIYLKDDVGVSNDEETESKDNEKYYDKVGKTRKVKEEKVKDEGELFLLTVNFQALFLYFNQTFKSIIHPNTHPNTGSNTHPITHSNTYQSPIQTPIKGIGMNTKSIVVFAMLMMLMMFVVHCTWVTSNAYSSPSIVLASQNSDG